MECKSLASKIQCILECSFKHDLNPMWSNLKASRKRVWKGWTRVFFGRVGVKICIKVSYKLWIFSFWLYHFELLDQTPLLVYHLHLLEWSLFSFLWQAHPFPVCWDYCPLYCLHCPHHFHFCPHFHPRQERPPF